MIAVRPIRPGEGEALFSMVRALAESHDFLYWLMMDWNKEAATLYQSVGAEIDASTSFCRIHGEALEALAG